MCLWSPYRAQQEHPLDGASDTGLSSSTSSQLKLPQTLVRAPSTNLRSSAHELSIFTVPRDMSHFTGEETEAQIGNAMPRVTWIINDGADFKSRQSGPWASALHHCAIQTFFSSINVLLISNIAHALQQAETRNQWQEKN